ncbi:MAG: hypothetical protein EOR68_33515 [Mesorhizobium sp.]|nr:MAG: hypothetical protein EOR68_33515 [Mesorhizobium sp.]TIP41445.1 MAG: hypothetical protein E5X77_26015 [Mesorhizobium sp.]TJV67783.1 MAG: hypothetical protein E5X76_32465 [Mesorhizobium sp.]
MQLSERHRGYARRAKRHSGTDGRIEHPSGHDDDHAGRHFNVNDLAAGAPLCVQAANPPPTKCVPAVTNFNFLPDMGRMTARLRSAGAIGFSRAASPRPSALNSFM